MGTDSEGLELRSIVYDTMGRRSIVGELIGSQSEVLSISINPKWHRQDLSWGGNQYGSMKEG